MGEGSVTTVLLLWGFKGLHTYPELREHSTLWLLVNASQGNHFPRPLPLPTLGLCPLSLVSVPSLWSLPPLSGSPVPLSLGPLSPSL